MLRTPVLFLIFNRPDLTEQVFQKIREAKPQKLFIAADGPRSDKVGEKEKCSEARSIILNAIDWDCEVHTLLRESNLGCKIAVNTAISWFFDNVEQGIILEDDILPDQSFFKFCEEMLNKYADDERVLTVCGANLLGDINSSESYTFSRMFGVWGWASWKRSWMYYDGDIKQWGNEQVKKNIKNFLGDKDWFEQVKGNLDMVYNKQFDTWDYQLVFTQLFRNGLSIIPGKNLITNIGFRDDATHTKSMSEAITSKMRLNSLVFPLRHPSNVVANQVYDKYYFSLAPKREIYLVAFAKRVKRKLARMIKNN